MKKDTKNRNSSLKHFCQNSHTLMEKIEKNGTRSLNLVGQIWEKNVEFAVKNKTR